MGYSVFGHPGTRFKVTQMKSGKFMWQIFAWREVLADGTEETEEAAEREMTKAAGRVLVKSAKKMKNRSNLYNRLKELCRKRPFLSIFVLDAIVNDMDLSNIMEAAQGEEEGRHKEAEVKLGWPPLELHPLSKPAKTVAMQLWETIEELEWDRQRVDRFAREYIGTAYSNPEAARPIEVVRFKKRKGE